MTNYVQPTACEILNVKQETDIEWTFRIATDIKPQHGQFLELSIPRLLYSRLTPRISFHPLLGISLISPMLNPVSISSYLVYSLSSRLPIVS